MPEQENENAANTAKLKGARILLVEDNELNQELAAELLAINGMTAMIAENGQVALDGSTRKPLMAC